MAVVAPTVEPGADASPTAVGLPPEQITYQPGLDGLRALAVVAVMAFHGQKLKGGFLGVDIFFVLSGYLITTLLLRERQQTGRIGFRGFYARRLRRLLPALIIVLLGSLAYAQFIAGPVTVSRIRHDTLGSLFYVQNWLLVREPWPSTSSPLSQTWSLAVEEQWYLLWPVLLAGLLALRRPRVLLIALVIATAASVAWTAHVTALPMGEIHAQFGTDTRGQSLLVGATLAVALQQLPTIGRRAARVVDIAGLLGFGALAVIIFRTHKAGTFFGSGGYLLVAISTSCVIVAAVQPSGRLLRPMLSWKPLVLLGLISYGVYLFHVPIFMTLTPGRTHLSPSLLFFVRVTITLAVATLTFLFIERPIRQGALRGHGEVAAAAVAIVSVIALLLIVTNGVRQPTITDRANPADLTALRKLSSSDAKVKKVLVVGDTLAASLGGPSWRPVKLGRLLGVSFTSSKCGVAQGQLVANRIRFAGRTCNDWPSHYSEVVEAFRPDVAILMIGTRELNHRYVDGQLVTFGTPAFEAELSARLDDARARLSSQGARVLLTTVPCAPSPEASQTAPADRVRELNGFIRRYVASSGTTVGVLDLNRQLCGESGRVEPITASWRDSGTGLFTLPGAVAVWNWLEPIAGAPR